MKAVTILAAVVVLAYWPTAAEAQKIVRAQVSEDFAPDVKVSGSVLVGAVLGSLSGSADPRKLVVPAGAATGGKPLCFTAKTRDGQYLAEAQLPKQVVPTEEFVIVPEGDWKHLDELRAYSFSDFAALVRIGEDCALDPRAPIMPVRYPSAGLPTFTAFVNSQRSLSASIGLKLKDGRRVEGPCTKADATQVRSAAFDMVCSVQLPAEAQGALELTVVRRARLGVANDIFEIYVPASAGASLGQ